MGWGTGKSINDLCIMSDASMNRIPGEKSQVYDCLLATLQNPPKSDKQLEITK
jgi:hypothetical protein